MKLNLKTAIFTGALCFKCFAEDPHLPDHMFKPNDILLENCNFINVAIDRILHLDDIEESFTLILSLQIAFMDECVSNVTEDPEKWPVHSKWSHPMIKLDEKRFWEPLVFVRNAISDHDFSSFKSFLLFDQQRKQIIYSKIGKITLYCDLDFFYFPLDEQNCHMIISFLEPTEIVQISGVTFELLSATAMPANSMIIMDGKYTQIEIFEFNGRNFSQVFFGLLLRRQAHWHILFLFGPSFILCTLELTSFFIPPLSPDRASFCITILLAFTVLQNQIVNSIPVSPKIAIIQYYVFFELIYSMFVSAYAAAMCCFMNTYSHIANRSFTERFKVWQIVDMVANILAILLLFILNAIVLLTIYMHATKSK